MAGRLPDWLIYAAATMALVVAAMVTREGLDAPPAPPPLPEDASITAAPDTPFDPAGVVDAPARRFGPVGGTAFVVGQSGWWLSAPEAVAGCRRIGVEVGPGAAVVAHRVSAGKIRDLVLLKTEGAPTPLPIASARTLADGQLGFILGFPQGRPGEVAVRLIGPEGLKVRGRPGSQLPVLAWAEVGRTQGVGGGLQGLAGGPVLDPSGQVMGVAVAESPRRGRLFTVTPAEVGEALAGVVQHRDAAVGMPVTPENYGRAADSLRRDLRVARVRCLD